MKKDIKDIAEELENGVKELFESEKYAEYLRVMSRFHNYSMRNTILIYMQKPDASRVAGFVSWRDNFGRNVRKGETGIRILAPAPFKTKRETERKDPVTGQITREEEETTVPVFKVVSVFDVSQTEGRDLPQIGVNELTGGTEKYAEIFAALEEISPYPIAFEDIKSGAKGYCDFEEKRIAIKTGMSETQNLKTAIHEIAHARLHGSGRNTEAARTDKHNREVTAESCAFVVCSRLGIDTSDYSFAYIAGWSAGKNTETLKESLDTIKKEAGAVIDEIEKHSERSKERGADPSRDSASAKTENNRSDTKARREHERRNAERREHELYR
jgi:antirestriction protein ArdC